MKAEYSVLCQYAWRLVVDKSINLEDFNRIEQSLESKAHGFIHDMSCLLDDFRLALSTGYFALGEHTRCIFKRARHSKLPTFCWVLFNRVFEPDGTIREDLCQNACSEIISLLSLLKRTSPPRGHGPVLSDKVWSTLIDNFADYAPARDHFVDMFEDDTFASIMTSAQSRFRERMSRIPFEANLVYGPGKNLDKHPSEVNMDWTLELPEERFYPIFRGDSSSSISRLYRKIKRLTNYVPFIARGDPRRRTHKRMQVLDDFSYTMKCTAVPKSYKAYRGVGVMPAARMMLQLSLQKSFYRHALDDNLPLSDQTQMERNILQNFEHIGTIDLSSASDRMYWWFLDFLGGSNTFYQKCRSLRTRMLLLPKGRSVRCSAPVMGEAITFPLMSTAFVSVALAVCDYYGWGHDMVKVYGDDIQTPFYEETLEVLMHIGAKPSLEKSYPPISRFKESCEAHYVGDFDSSLRYVRPAYIPSYDFNRRHRLTHQVALQLLMASRAAYRTSKELSWALADVVENHTSLVLPPVASASYQIGRVGEMSNDAHLQVVTHALSEQSLSFVGHIKAKLHSCVASGSDPHVDPKVHYIQETKRILMQTKKLVVNQSRQRLEAGIMRYYFRSCDKENAEKVCQQTTDEATISCAVSLMDHEHFSLWVKEFLTRIAPDLTRRTMAPSA